MMVNPRLHSELLGFLVEHTTAHPDQPQLPSLNEIGRQLNISVARLREQLEVAKALNLVEVRPRTGIKLTSYNFGSAIWLSLSYALAIDQRHFDQFANLRKEVEMAFWRQAVDALTSEDKASLENLVERAFNKLHGTPIRIPHAEHRELHLRVFQRLDNPFVQGILEAYWNAYEAVGLSIYADFNYLEQVWAYHKQMIDAIVAGDTEAGYQAFVEHADLLQHIPRD